MAAFNRRFDISQGGGMDADVQYLESLGYKQQLSRVMGIWSNFALGFTYLSPLVGIYSLFAYALATGGGAVIWAIPLVVVGQAMVVLVFGEVASQYPIAGGIYQWARRLGGRGYGWFTGWVYTWALLATVAAVAYGSAGYVAALFGTTATTGFTIGIAIAMVAIAAVINLFGAQLLSKAATVGLVAEFCGGLLVGLYLLFFHHRQPISAIFHHQGAGGSHYTSAFLAAGLMAIWIFFGFEACGDVAEEVKDPGRRVPRAMLMTLGMGGLVSFLLTLGLILAVPNLPAVIGGQDADPATTILNASFGTVAAKLVLLLIVLGFLSCTLAIQAAAVRTLFSQGRDGVLPGSSWLARVSPRFHMAPAAVVVAFVIPGVIVLVSWISTDALTKIIAFATVGIYVGFQLVVLAALRARTSGWRPAGPFTLGQWATAVNVLGLAYGVGAIVNLVWPRTPGTPWYDNYIVLVSLLVVAAVGAIYGLAFRPYEHGTAPAGDAVPSVGEPELAGS
ncbi:MAG TPA: amino acid permease [Gaiellaceae bacterium]|nr:amino acid permease [Gaiellaceae bacterium]